MENKSQIDIITVFLYLLIAALGIASVYSATSEMGTFTLLEGRSGKQLIWFGISIVIGIILFLLNAEVFQLVSWYIYIAIILLLIGVLLFGAEIAGSKSWIKLGSFSIQPAEFAKYGAALGLASYLSSIDVSLSKLKHIVRSIAIFALPAILVVLQGDAGSALVYSSFILVLYREGLTPAILIIGIVAIGIFVLTMVLGVSFFAVLMVTLFAIFYAFTYSNKKWLKPSVVVALICIAFSFSVSFLFNNVLQQHQQKRILVTLNLLEDDQGAGYNVNQSKIAIGSGGFSGKGFLNGSHTKGDFIPEQTTDFIFCTIGEEGGWLISSLTILLFVLLILRLYYLASLQRKKFKRIFIFSIASILFFHLTVNVGMTIGLMPVIGIPLPLISYGGSSILAFSIFIITALKLDSTRYTDLTSVYD